MNLSDVGEEVSVDRCPVTTIFLAQFMLKESSFLYGYANFAPSAYIALEDMIGVTKPLNHL